ncbi:MAG: hypothetical protein K6U00_06405 [Armatimonadetes bacterium]|nr:hypothetical protein [Armatimonadota bacterium]
MQVKRFSSNPIIYPHMDSRVGDNINGPSLIRVPTWIRNPLGRYYLYFGHHKGTYIRLAYADELAGPWSIYTPGVLDLRDSFAEGHIASPDVHMDADRRQIRMYYHGPTPEGQQSRVAISQDGLHFEARGEILGGPYFRVFKWRDYWYALAMPGIFYRSRDGLSDFEQGPNPFAPMLEPSGRMMRHSALRLKGNTLTVFYSVIGDAPEHIVSSIIELTDDWTEWKPSPPVSILLPEEEYEGAALPVERSRMGWAPEPINQLRDPCIFEEDGKTYLLYSVAGEQGIAIAEITEE